jgi:hypothetical protein
VKWPKAGRMDINALEKNDGIRGRTRMTEVVQWAVSMTGFNKD